MRVLFLLAVAAVLTVASATGCGPAVPASELGETVFEVPKVAGTEKPYPLPKCEAKNPFDEMREQ